VGTFRTALVIVGRRMTANLRLVLALLLGVVIAAALLASAPIYARAMADLGLVFSVRSRFPVPPTTRVLTYEQGLPLKAPESQALVSAIPQRMRERIGWFSSGYSRFIRMPALAAGKPGEPIPTSITRPVVLVQSMDGYESHVKVTAGALPEPVDTAGSTTEYQVALSANAAGVSGLAVGDHILLGDVFDDCERHVIGPDQPPDPPCTPHTSVSRSVAAVVTGLVAPLSDDDPFWADGIGAYFAPTPATATNGSGAPLFMPAATLTGPFGDLFPSSWPRQYWYAYADVGMLKRDNYQRAGNDLEAFRKEMEDAGVLSFSTLPAALRDFSRQLSYDQAPLVILLLQITGIALFYVAIVAAMTVERQLPEIALLRSRGASGWQILTVYLIEGLIIAVPAFIIAPFLGLAFTRLLGLTPTFHSVTNGHLIPATLEPAAFALGALGAALSVVAILLPAFFATHFSGITLRRQLGRPQTSIVQRYYLDIGLLAICGVLLWETNSRGTVFKPGTTGGLSTDPLLLLTPALTTLALAVLVLRVYPLLLRAAGRLFAAGAGVTVVLGLWQLTRNPAQYTRLGLLLMMGIAVGGFSASYSDTTNRSYREQALYAAAVDMRGAASTDNVFAGPAQADAAFATIPGVSRASGALRMDIDFGSAGSTRDKVQMLALDPAAGRSMLWYRPGLSRDSLDTLMNDLGTPTDQIGKPVPGEPVSFTLWANPTLAREQTTAWARFRGADGRYEMYELGKLDFTGWRQITAQLNSVGTRPSFPISLVAIVLTQPASGFATKRDPTYFDDLSVTQADGSESIVDNFENSFSWNAAPAIASEQDEVAASSEAHHGGTRSLKFTFRTGSAAELRAAYVSDRNVPLPAVVSRDFIRGTGLAVGGVTNLLVGDHVVPIRIAGTADLFPSLDPGRGPFVLLNRSDLLEWLPRLVSSQVDSSNEFWLQLSPSADRQAVIRTVGTAPYKLTNITDLASELKLNGADPLIASGGSGILLISFISALVLAAGAFLVSLYTSLRRRRIEFAVMGALGLGRSRVFAMLAFEYAVMAAIGAGAGLWLGLGISRLMLSFLDVTPSGDKVVPPYVLVTNWTMIGAALGCLALIVLGSIAVAARSYTSASESAVLRNTE
jgi:FtsX-like permease family